MAARVTASMTSSSELALQPSIESLRAKANVSKRAYIQTLPDMTTLRLRLCAILSRERLSMVLVVKLDTDCADNMMLDSRAMVHVKGMPAQ